MINTLLGVERAKEGRDLHSKTKSVESFTECSQSTTARSSTSTVWQVAVNEKIKNPQEKMAKNLLPLLQRDLPQFVNAVIYAVQIGYCRSVTVNHDLVDDQIRYFTIITIVTISHLYTRGYPS